MKTEIERKFIANLDFKAHANGSILMVQGYLNSNPERAVRIRISQDKAWLTIKGKSDAKGLSRPEWETEVDVNEAKMLLNLCEPGVIKKIRYHVPCGKHLFEVDVFEEDNEGLILAEIELDHEDEEFDHPEWLIKEVTGDVRYYNAYLAKQPFKGW